MRQGIKRRKQKEPESRAIQAGERDWSGTWGDYGTNV